MDKSFYQVRIDGCSVPNVVIPILSPALENYRLIFLTMSLCPAIVPPARCHISIHRDVVNCVSQRGRKSVASRTKIGLLERDFKKRVHDSLGKDFSRAGDYIQVISMPIDDPRFHTSSRKKHLVSTQTSMGLDLLLFAKVATHKSYIPTIYAMSALSVSSSIVPVFVEAATIIDSKSPFPVMISKYKKKGKGPVYDLVKVDSRFQKLLRLIKEKASLLADVGNRRVRLKMDMSFETGIIPMGTKSLIAMRCLADYQGNVDTLGGLLPVFNYGFPRPALELMGRLAYYTKYLAYSGPANEDVEQHFLIQKVLDATGVLEERV